MAWEHGTFFWNELMTRDAEAAKKFYQTALGWNFEKFDMAPGMGPYWVAKVADKPVAGIFTMAGPDFANVPENWMSYIAVDDVDARVKKAVAAGAKVMRPSFDVQGVGRMAILAEPGGAVIGWITPTNT